MGVWRDIANTKSEENMYRNGGYYRQGGIIGTIYDVTMQLYCYIISFIITQQCSDYIWR
jgi:hypothetical protein